MKSSVPSKLGVALLILAAGFSGGLVGCSSDSANTKRDPEYRPKNPFKNDDRDSLRNRKSVVSEKDLKLEADQLYRVARGALEASDFSEAEAKYDAIMERYPFTEFATQAELEKIYAYYRDYKTDEALSAAERFLREHPRHPRADYVQYLKGVIQMERDKGLAEAVSLDTTKQDVSNQRKAYDEFALLLQKYPASRYDEDARARMLHLRNRIAENEMHVVHFYMKRGAWLAAAKRSEQIVGQYPGAPVTLEALAAMRQSYKALGLNDQAQDAQITLAAQNDQKYLAATPPPVADTGAATAAVAPANPATTPAPKPGLMARFAGLFSFLDSDKHPAVEYVLPIGKAAPSSTATAPAAGTASNPSTATDGAAPDKASSTTTPAAAPADAKPHRSGLIVEINGDDTTTAPTASATPAPTPDASAKPGLLSRIRAWFSRSKPADTAPATAAPSAEPTQPAASN